MRTPHPNVTRALYFVENKFGKIAGVIFPLMMDLEKYERDVCYGLLDLQLTRHVVHGIVSGIGHLHSLGILHRDVKPKNILVRGGFDRPSIVVADLGCSTLHPDLNKVGGPATATDQLTPGMVTWPFRAPEIEMNLHYSYPSDVWSVGLVTKSLLTGCDWFHGKRAAKEKRAPLLRWIESLAGPITEDSWKGVSQSASWQEYRETWPCDPFATSTPFTTPVRPLPPDGEQLANEMLRLLPENRISAAAALTHGYLGDVVSEVLPCPPTLAPVKRPLQSAVVPTRVPVERPLQSAVVGERFGSEMVGGSSGHAGAQGGQSIGLQTAQADGAVAADGVVAGALGESGAQEDGAPGLPRKAEETANGCHVSAKRRRLRKKSARPSSYALIPSVASLSSGPSVSTPQVTTAAVVLWQGAATETPDKEPKSESKCICKGWCFARHTAGHQGTWSTKDKSTRGCCMNESLPGLKVCGLCKCAEEDCGSLSRGASKHCFTHQILDMCLELRKVSEWAEPLSRLDPVDLQEYLSCAPQLTDLLLRTLLADTWEPVPVQTLTAKFALLPRNYTGAQIAACFRETIAELSDESIAGELTQAVMRTAGINT